MTRILAVGVSPELVSFLEHRLEGVEVKAARHGQEALAALAQGGWQLLVIDHDVTDPPALALLAEMRKLPAWSNLPIIYCLEEGAPSELQTTLVREFGVEQLCFHPLDREELARQLSGRLNLSLRSQPKQQNQAQDQALAAVAGLWTRFKGTVLGRVEVVEQALSALLEGDLSDELRRKAEQEAHKLAGSVGSFGFKEASRLALEIERSFRAGSTLEQAQALSLSETAAALRRELESRPAGQSTVPSGPAGDSRPVLLVVDSDEELAQQLVEEAGNREVRAEVAKELSAARELLGRCRPDVVLLDLSLPQDVQDSLRLLEELAACDPAVPTLILTASDSLIDRVEVARRGGRGFLQKPLPPSDVLDAVMQLLNRMSALESKVMVVDDDPLVLAALRALLEPKRIHVITLDEPLRFWEAFQRTSPNLLILDVEMPHLNGIELCRVVRNDPRWFGIPVLFLTMHTDAETVRRVFAAGADDFVCKPVVGPELLTRISNRLEHARLYRTFVETDPLTGVANRRTSTTMMNQLIRLASRIHQPFSFAMLDLDNFKQINDTHGHAVGDQVLRKLGTFMLRTFRGEDVVARWGGEEFSIGMFGMRQQDAVQRITGMLEAFREETFTTPAGVGFHVTFSAGLAQYPEDGDELPSLYRAADKALYQAKRAGRNRVQVTDQTDQELPVHQYA
ncbi:MAG: response regulator [Terriglobia bacterium]